MRLTASFVAVTETPADGASRTGANASGATRPSTRTRTSTDSLPALSPSTSSLASEDSYALHSWVQDSENGSLLVHYTGLENALPPLREPLVHNPRHRHRDTMDAKSADESTTNSRDANPSSSPAPTDVDSASMQSALDPTPSLAEVLYGDRHLEFPSVYHQPRQRSESGITIASSAYSLIKIPPASQPPSLVAGCAHSSSWACDKCTISHSSAVPTDLASAVSGIPIFDDDVAAGDSPPQRTAQFECPFFYLRCSFATDDKSRWLDHCPSHFRGRSPPVSGSKCPLCPFKATPDMIPEEQRLTMSEKRMYMRKANSRDAHVKPVTEAESRQAWALWAVRQEHVAGHHENGYSLAAAEPDFDMFRYLHQQKLIEDSTYKDLTVDPSGLGDDSPVTQPVGRRER